VVSLRSTIGYKLGCLQHPKAIKARIGFLVLIERQMLICRSMRTPVPELVEGALTKPYIYYVTYASGSESSVLFPWLMLLLLLILPSVFVRVCPWLMLLLLLGLPSWLIFCFAYANHATLRNIYKNK